MRVADQVAGVLARARLNEDRRRLSAAIEQTAESIIITDTGGRIEYVNPGFEKTTGYTRAEALGRRLNMLYSGHHDAAFYSNLWQTISSGKVWHGQFINRKKNGDLYNDDATITPGRDDSGAIVNYVSVQRDVTRELQLEAQYRQAQKMDAIGQLTGGIAHDFNNLLTAINGFADLARAALEPDDPKKEMMDKVLYSGQRAADLVRQLLAFSRKQVIEPKVLNLNTVVTDTDKMLRRILGEHIFIDTRLVPRLYPVKIDPAQIQQVILNMAVNARDAMPDGGRLTIETVNVSLAANDLAVYADLQPGDYVQLTMRDTGHGMTSAVLARVFEPFFTTKEVGKGTGLGLATVYGIVKQNGGDIVCHSEVGRGATFRVLLPVSREGVVTEAAGQSGQWPAGEETILLVEDDPMVREFVLHTLRAQGYNIIVAANGPRALQMAQAYQEPIHLLLTDVVMPGMSGSEVAERLRAQKPGLKIIFTSGYTDETVIRHGVQESELTFLPKPFSPMELAKKVREILDQ
jgi:PAS domain S-box-containing protein